MKKMSYRTSILSYVLILALFFVIGYNTGKINGTQKAREEYETLKKEAAIETTINTAEDVIKEYEVKINNNMLYLYAVEGEFIHKLAEEAISEELYPKEDIEELKKGIIFKDKQDAQVMFENFSS